MPRKNILSLFPFLFVLNIALVAQIPGFNMEKGVKKIDIPFEKQDNFIIINLVFQGIFPLKFIFDTGAEHTILIKKNITTILQTPYDREIVIMGTDMKTQIKAYITRRMRMDLQGLSLVKDILVLDEDYFKFEQFLGLNVHGILGAEVFKGHIIKIDYVKQVLTVYDPSVFREPDFKKYERVPIEVVRSKPYIKIPSKINKDSTVQLKLLMDTGASLSLLLHAYSTPGLDIPKQVIKGNIGNGLGGTIDGYIGRVNVLNFGALSIGNIITHFHELNLDTDSVFLNQRNGLIGGDVLSRFTVVIDFNRENAYFLPNRYFKNKFIYDKSGAYIVKHGTEANKFIVWDITPNTPASEVDLQKGDEIITINRIYTRFYQLGAINRIFQGRDGKKIRLAIRRDGKKMLKTIKLRTLI
jgi:hypothetical protein